MKVPIGPRPHVATIPVSKEDQKKYDTVFEELKPGEISMSLVNQKSLIPKPDDVQEGRAIHKRKSKQQQKEFAREKWYKYDLSEEKLSVISYNVEMVSTVNILYLFRNLSITFFCSTYL
jgi:hypothetical protein